MSVPGYTGLMSTAETRCLGFFPALRLEKNLQFGDWMVGTPPRSTRWASPRFQEVSTLLIKSFEKRKLRDGALLWHRTRGFDGSRPDDADAVAIAAAVAFAALDANDLIPAHFRPRQLASTENTELFLQPLDDKGRIVHVRGGLIRRESVFNWPLGEEPPPFGEALVPLEGPVSASPKLATSFYNAVRNKSGDGPSIAVAAEWHRSAMANPFAVTMQQRLIALKTAFEALFHEDKSHLCAKLLRRRFETVAAGHFHLLPSRALLWSPDERTDLVRTWKRPDGNVGGTGRRTELEDWFMTLADARNEVIHKGTLSTRGYAPPPERPLSRYVGHLLYVGERVLRETIKAMLGVDILLCGPIAQQAADEASVEALKQYAASLPPAPAAAAPPAPVPGRSPRTLATLLASIECSAANLVTIGGGFGDFSASRITPRSVDDWWGESETEAVVNISEEEYEILQKAGAEVELADRWWYPCD